MIPVKYIGFRKTYREGTYGSYIVFEQGQTVNIEDEDLARKLLRHTDAFVRGDAEQATDTAEKQDKKPEDEEENNLQDTRDAIAAMDKNSLETFAKTHFNVNLDKRRSVGAMRAEVTGMVDRFGVA